MTIKGTVRGKTIELPTALPYPDGQEVTIDVIVATNGAPVGSPRALLAAIVQGPQVETVMVDELERAIHAGRRVVRFDGTFDADQIR